jgi:hypothetical protein
MDGHLLNIGCAIIQLRNKTICHSPHTSLNNISAADQVESLNKPTKYQHLQEFPLSATLVDGSPALNINQEGRWGIRQTSLQHARITIPLAAAHKLGETKTGRYKNCVTTYSQYRRYHLQSVPPLPLTVSTAVTTYGQ